MLVQTQAPAPEIQLVHRSLRESRSYQVDFTFGSDDSPRKISYVLRIHPAAKDKRKSERELQFEIDGYSIQAEGKRYKSNRVGAGTIKIADSGLPERALEILSSKEYLYPWYVFCVPTNIDKGTFTVETALSEFVKLKGNGSVKGDEYTLEGDTENAKDKLSIISVKWVLDAKGWPLRGSGTVDDETGTSKFSLRER